MVCCSNISHFRFFLTESNVAVSIQTVSAAVTTLVSGLSQVQSEIKMQRQSRNAHPEDRFVQVMEVRDTLSLMK